MVDNSEKIINIKLGFAPRPTRRKASGGVILLWVLMPPEPPVKRVVVFVDGQARPVQEFSSYLGETTNNVAEYLALVYALQEALRSGYTAVTVKTDSELLERQMNGRYKVRDERLRLFHDLARHLAQGFRRCVIAHVPRTQNILADRLATQAVRTQRRPLDSASLRSG